MLICKEANAIFQLSCQAATSNIPSAFSMMTSFVPQQICGFEKVFVCNGDILVNLNSQLTTSVLPSTGLKNDNIRPDL
jgi:hypothetical protein